MEEVKEAKPGIILDATPETGEVNAGIDVDRDGKVDFSISVVITDKRFWAVVSIGIAIGLIAKGYGIW